MVPLISLCRIFALLTVIVIVIVIVILIGAMSEIKQLLHKSSRCNIGQLTCRKKKKEKISRNLFHPKWKRPDIFVDFLRCERCLKGISSARASPRLCFLFWKRHILSKEEGKKHFTFQLPPAPSPRSSSPGLVSKERRKREGMLFTCVAAALPLILLLSFQLPLLCMKQRGRLKAFTGHSDNEERRSSELY